MDQCYKNYLFILEKYDGKTSELATAPFFLSEEQTTITIQQIRDANFSIITDSDNVGSKLRMRLYLIHKQDIPVSIDSFPKLIRKLLTENSSYPKIELPMLDKGSIDVIPKILFCEISYPIAQTNYQDIRENIVDMTFTRKTLDNGMLYLYNPIIVLSKKGFNFFEEDY